MFSRAAKSFFLRAAAVPAWQPAFEFLHRVALAGMNIGTGSHLDDSGELFLLSHIRQLLRAKYSDEELCLFDVGANIGDYAQALRSVFGDTASIYSFEPASETFEHLIARAGNSVRAFQCGMSHTRSVQGIYSTGNQSGLNSLYRRNLDHVGLHPDLVEEVHLDTIDLFCADHDIGRIHFLKMDVEGHELAVLQGASKMVASDRIDCIQFEFGGCNIDSRTYFQDFYTLLCEKYDLYRVLHRGVRPIRTYAESQEIFTTTNFFASHKTLSRK